MPAGNKKGVNMDYARKVKIEQAENFARKLCEVVAPMRANGASFGEICRRCEELGLRTLSGGRLYPNAVKRALQFGTVTPAPAQGDVDRLERRVEQLGEQISVVLKELEERVEVLEKQVNELTAARPKMAMDAMPAGLKPVKPVSAPAAPERDIYAETAQNGRQQPCGAYWRRSNNNNRL